MAVLVTIDPVSSSKPGSPSGHFILEAGASPVALPYFDASLRVCFLPYLLQITSTT